MTGKRFPPLYGLLIGASVSAMLWVYGLQLIGAL